MTHLSVRTWGAALFVVFVLHNAEEAVGFTYANEGWLALLEALNLRQLSMTPAAFARSLSIVTACSAVIAAWIILAPASSATRIAVRIWAVTLVANVFVPHLPAAIIAADYVPGVVTAVLLNLPVGLACLHDTRIRADLMPG